MRAQYDDMDLTKDRASPAKGVPVDPTRVDAARAGFPGPKRNPRIGGE